MFGVSTSMLTAAVMDIIKHNTVNRKQSEIA